MSVQLPKNSVLEMHRIVDSTSGYYRVNNLTVSYGLLSVQTSAIYLKITVSSTIRKSMFTSIWQRALFLAFEVQNWN